MIKKILTYYALRLDEYLSRLHHQPEGMAQVGFVGGGMDEKPCKVIISLLSIERETAGGINTPIQRNANTGYVNKFPPLLLNVNLMLAAVYEQRRYAESLSILSDTLCFIQSSPNFEVDGMVYTVEIVNLSTQEINNIWTTLGGQYYPSVVCKLRRLVIDDRQIIGTTAEIREPVVKNNLL